MARMSRVAFPAIAVFILCLAAPGCLPGDSDQYSDKHEAVAVVEAYVEARADGDAQRACEQLTEPQQYELVAHVTGNYQSSSPQQCESYVLQVSSRSTAVRPELAGFVNAELETRPGKAGSIDVAPVGSPEFLELINEDGKWKIDGRAAEKESFLKVHCPEMGFEQEPCECIFERLRHANVNIYNPRTPRGTIREELRAGVRACTPTA